MGTVMRLRPAIPLTTGDPSASRVAALVLHLEEARLPNLTLTTLAVRGLGGSVQAWVICHLEDGSREKFTPGDARLIAIGLRDAAGMMRQLNEWADSVDDAADAGERQASAILMGMDQGRGVGFGPSAAHPFWRGR